MKNKYLIMLTSLLTLPLSMVGASVGFLLTWLVGWLDYDSLIYIYYYSESFIMGTSAGFVAGFGVMKIIKSNENFIYIIALPLLGVVLSSLHSLWSGSRPGWADFDTLMFLISNITFITVFIYYVKNYHKKPHLPTKLFGVDGSMEHKPLIMLTSLLAIPLCMAGIVAGVFLTWVLSWSRYEDIWGFFKIVEPLISGATGGFVAGFGIMKIIKSNENFIYIISLPLILMLLFILAIFLEKDLTTAETLRYYAIYITIPIVFIYYVKKYPESIFK